MRLTVPFLRPVVALLSLVCAAVCFAAGGGGGGGGGDPEVAGEILVKLRSTDALPGLLARYPVTLVSRFGARPIYRLKTIGSATTKEVIAGLALEAEVMIAEPNTTHQSPEARKNQPWVVGSGGNYVEQWAFKTMRMAAARKVGQGEGVRVAVLDTGIDPNHPLFAGRLLPGFDFVDFDTDPSEVGSAAANPSFGHGTHVAGLVALAAPKAKIMPIRILDSDGVGNAWVLGEALLYAIDPDGNPATDDGAHIINLSLGSLTRTRLLAALASIASCSDDIPDDPISDRSDPGYNDDKTRCLRGAGTVVVAAAGNDGSSSVKEYPAAEGAYGLIAITASNNLGNLASFANTGSWIDIAAPGDGITSAFPGGGYATWSGSSMAAPLTSGTAALVRGLDFTLSAKDLIERLKRASAALCQRTTNLRRVDALAAVTNLPLVTERCR